VLYLAEVVVARFRDLPLERAEREYGIRELVRATG
jgi:hypothetical protein